MMAPIERYEKKTTVTETEIELLAKVELVRLDKIESISVGKFYRYSLLAALTVIGALAAYTKDPIWVDSFKMLASGLVGAAAVYRKKDKE